MLRHTDPNLEAAFRARNEDLNSPASARCTLALGLGRRKRDSREYSGLTRNSPPVNKHGQRYTYLGVGLEVNVREEKVVVFALACSSGTRQCSSCDQLGHLTTPRAKTSLQRTELRHVAAKWRPEVPVFIAPPSETRPPLFGAVILLYINNS